MKPNEDIFLQREFLLASAKYLRTDTTNLGPPYSRFKTQYLSEKESNTVTKLQILGRGESFPVHCYPEVLTLWDICVKRVKRNLSRLSTPHFGQALSFIYKPSYLASPPKLKSMLQMLLLQMPSGQKRFPMLGLYLEFYHSP